MLWRDFSGFVGELPRRIGENGREAATLGEGDKVERSSAPRYRYIRAVNAFGLRHRPFFGFRKQQRDIRRRFRRQAADEVFAMWVVEEPQLRPRPRSSNIVCNSVQRVMMMLLASIARRSNSSQKLFRSRS